MRQVRCVTVRLGQVRCGEVWYGRSGRVRSVTVRFGWVWQVWFYKEK